MSDGEQKGKDPDEAAINAFIWSFGRHVRSLRRARGLTQEQIAERAGLSADTIRRLEGGSFAAGLGTLWKISRGFRLPLSTIFTALDSGQEMDTEIAELATLLRERPDVPVGALVALIAAWPKSGE